jgi:hypothetical protein
MANMTLIEAKTLTSNTATVVFTAIPQTYTDLVLVVSTRTDGAYIADSLYVTMNSSTSNFSWENVYGRGTGTVISQNNTNNEIANAINGANSTSTTFSNIEIYIPNYRNTAHNKSITTIGSVENNAAIGDNYIQSILWNDTSSITSMTLAPIPGSAFLTNSTFYLYGIDAANDGAKATGGIISSDANYFYHVFTSSGTFTPTTTISADVLVVAGGGGTGTNGGGGGGAGGLRLLASQSVSTAQTVTIGGGGTGSTSTTATGGINTSFGSIAVTGGGRGGTGGGAPGNGGSGGGSHRTDAVGTGNAGSYSPAEGTNGAAGNGAGGSNGGGGGGASAAGSAGENGRGGNGGAGSDTYNSISFSQWLTVTATGVNGLLAGGGGGGGNEMRGLATGGGGNGGIKAGGGSNATISTGGGGGGGGENGGTLGGNGGSGLVIIRYAK